MPGLEQQHTFLIVGLYTTCNVPPTTPMVAQRISRGRGACGDGGWTTLVDGSQCPETSRVARHQQQV